MIFAVTGHRPNKVGGYNTPNPIFNDICTGMDQLLLRYQPSRVIIGMALGVDQWMADLCIFNGIPFTAAIPMEGFESRWPMHSQIKYRSLLRRAESVQIISTGAYEPWKMQRRNEWMVNNCDALIAVFDGTPGGTKNCVDYAIERQKPIHYVNFPHSPPIIQRERPRAPVELRPASEVLRDVQVAVRTEPSEGLRQARERGRRQMMEDEREERRLRVAEVQRQVTQAVSEGLQGFIGRPVEEVVNELAQPILEHLNTHTNAVAMNETPVNDAVQTSRRRRFRETTLVIQETAPEPVVETPKEPVRETEDLVKDFGRIIEFE